MTVPFIGPSYRLATRKADVQRSVNLFPVMNEVVGGKTASYLQSVPGLDLFSGLPEPEPFDPFWNSVILLAHMDLDFADSSQFNATPILTGGPVISAAQSKFSTGAGTTSGAQNRNVQYVGEHLDLSTTDFTIELWRYRTIEAALVFVMGQQQATSSDNFAWYLGDLPATPTTRFVGLSQALSAAVSVATANPFSNGVWNHFAVTRSGSTFRIFLNGVLQNSSTYAGTLWDPPTGLPGVRLFQQFLSGAPTFSTNDFQNEVRITTVCRYTADFAVPTAPFPNSGPP